MVEKRHTETFSSSHYEKTVSEMRTRGEKVHDAGQKVYRETGKLDPMVDIKGKTRESRNAFIDNGNNTCLLTKGIKMPVVSCGDGTGSMGENVGKVFFGMKKLFDMLSPFQLRYQIDLSVAVVQDVQDKHPVFQMAQFESSNLAAEHVTKLIPDKDGGDSDEDYDLGLCYINDRVNIDINQYCLKGYLFIIADACGRGRVLASDVKNHLGYEIQSRSIYTKKICQELLKKWHVFFIQINSSYPTSSWWSDLLGDNRVIFGCDADYLAELQAGLMYITETEEPLETSFIAFLQASGNNKISDYDAKKIWQIIQPAKPLFGAQAKLDVFNNIPKPGDIFSHYRNPWPIGHARESENPTTNSVVTTPSIDSNEVDWTKF
ncbi:MAG: hypothetical protein WCT51_01160 [Candidatus Shapirobacteria bacterium]|jgi:hypothetical protein